ncbi:MAG: efflux RND transporter permease subunit, partial [Planctomycetota bacterium]|nr:efflux RND transporter permease subunit [Planctomycetota bacterium]
ERIYVHRFQSTDIPVLSFQLSAPWKKEDRLYRFIEDVVRRRLERLEGVAEVEVHGLRTREVQINMIPERLAAHGIDVREVSTVVRNNNVTVSGGPIREGSLKYLVRAAGKFRNLEEIRRLPVGELGLRLGDVADVEVDYPERESFYYLNGQEAMSLEVRKASTANLLSVAKQVRGEMGAILELPAAEGLQVKYYRDASLDVLNGLSELRNTGLLGGGLAIVFMFLFLRRFRTTLLMAIAIPLSVILTFVIMYLVRQAGWADLTLNIHSLMGLMLAIGMLVDNSIVVIESVFRHRQELGKDARSAALHGASEVALPISASTLTTICVFVPLIFLGSGYFSNMMRNIGVTIVIVMVASLMVALTVVPMVAAFLLGGESTRRQALFERFGDGYAATLRFTLRHRLAFSLLIVGILACSWHLYQSTGRSFSTPSYERRITVQVDVPRSFTIEMKRALFDEVYGLLDSRREELEIDDISHNFRRGSGRSRRYSRSNRIQLFLVDEEESRRNTAEIRDQLEELLPVRPGVTFTIGRSRRGPRRGRGGSVSMEIYGDRPEILEVLSRQVVSRLREVPTLRDIDSSLESGDEEIRVIPNYERTLQAGLSSQAVGQSIASALSSRAVSYFEADDREMRLVVQYREEDRQTLEQLKKLPVAFGKSPLPISAVADFEMAPGARTIERENRRAVVDITSDTVSGVPVVAALRDVADVLNTIDFPTGYDWAFESEVREQAQEASTAIFALLFALLLIYMIMASLFESFTQPFTIMFSVPFAFIGVGLVLALAGQPRGRTSDMGLIILAGIVVNNAIVLIHHINRLRRQGLSRDEAIVLGGRQRLRPILMTAATTVLSLSPMAAPFFLPQVFGAVEGRAAFWAPVGLVILGGLTTSTFLTVTVIPTIYSLVDDFTLFLKRIAVTAWRGA